MPLYCSIVGGCKNPDSVGGWRKCRDCGRSLHNSCAKDIMSGVGEKRGQRLCGLTYCLLAGDANRGGAAAAGGERSWVMWDANRGGAAAAGDERSLVVWEESKPVKERTEDAAQRKPKTTCYRESQGGGQSGNNTSPAAAPEAPGSRRSAQSPQRSQNSVAAAATVKLEGARSEAREARRPSGALTLQRGINQHVSAEGGAPRSENPSEEVVSSGSALLDAVGDTVVNACHDAMASALASEKLEQPLCEAVGSKAFEEAVVKALERGRHPPPGKKEMDSVVNENGLLVSRVVRSSLEPALSKATKRMNKACDKLGQVLEDAEGEKGEKKESSGQRSTKNGSKDDAGGSAPSSDARRPQEVKLAAEQYNGLVKDVAEKVGAMMESRLQAMAGYIIANVSARVAATPPPFFYQHPPPPAAAAAPLGIRSKNEEPSRRSSSQRRSSKRRREEPSSPSSSESSEASESSPSSPRKREGSKNHPGSCSGGRQPLAPAAGNLDPAVAPQPPAAPTHHPVVNNNNNNNNALGSQAGTMPGGLAPPPSAVVWGPPSFNPAAPLGLQNQSNWLFAPRF